MFTPTQIATIFGCTEGQARAGLLRSLTDMRDYLAKAKEIAPKKYRGYTVAQIETRIASITVQLKG